MGCFLNPEIRAALRPRPASLLTAVLSAAAILLVTTLGADMMRSSEWYNQSRVIGMIVRQDQVAVTDIAGNKRNVDIVLKFAGALTGAYINFEMIPLNEFGTFAAVFESLPAEVEIEKFEYHRKNLSISGSADTEEAYEQFLDALRQTDYFEGVTGHYYQNTDERIQFELECISQSTPVHLEFDVGFATVKKV